MNPDRTRKIIRNSKHSKKTYIGSRTSILGREENICVEDRHRVKHTLATGETGTGKTVELLHVALQDTVKGRGLCIINPKGELIDKYLRRVPEERIDDLVYVNPVDQPITGINVLEPYVNRESSIAAKTNQIELIVSNLIQLFRSLSDNWGDRFGRVLTTLLRAGIDANIEYQAGYTLLNIKHCAENTEELKRLIDDTGDPELRSQLIQIKDSLSDSQMEPVVRRLNDFTGNRTVRHVISTETSDIDFRELINQKKILLIDVREGEVGSTVTKLLTSIAVTKLWAAAQHRYYQRNEVEPFYLFIDELQSFPTESAHFEEILSKAREYRLGCWLATQYLSQLPRKMRDAVQNNCRTKLVFDPSGSDDLPKLNRMLRGTSQKQITGLGDFRAILQTPGTRTKEPATTVDTYPPWNTENIDIEALKKQASTATENQEIPRPVVGKGNNAGKERHTELLAKAEKILTQRGLPVKLLYQDAGDDKPDGYVEMPDESIAHLEAEHSTLSKPGKVLENLHRAAEKDRETIFIVESENAEKLENIFSDPVSRNGDQHTDSDGSYSYYRLNGEPFTEIDWIDMADYRILEVVEDDIRLYQGKEQNVRSKHSGLEELNDRERTILNCIKNGKDDTQKITSHTGLHRDKVTYSLRKLEKQGWIQITTPEEPVERVIDGQKHVFQVKVAELTPKAEDKV